MKISQNSFDTSILGASIYKMYIDSSSKNKEIETEVKKIVNGIIFCFAPVDSSCIKTLERLEFHLISIRNTYQYKGTEHKISSLPEGFSISPYIPEKPLSEKDIENLAVTIGRQTRYFKDAQISEDKAKEVYIQWIKNSLYHGWAARCFIARQEEKVIGICSVKTNDTAGEIDLLGVLPEAQGRKLGAHLIHEALCFLLSQDLNPITVVTAGENIKSNKLYQNNNFLINTVELVYHKHI